MLGAPVRRNGFTAVEILLVIVLLAILSLVFVPRFSYDAILKHQVYSTAHDVAADLRYARRLALGTGLEGSTSVSIGSGEIFWLEVYNSGSATDSWRILDNSNNAIKEVQAVSGVQIVQNATNSFYFDRDGVPYPAGGDYFIVEDYNGKYRWGISVIRCTGQVKLTEL